MGDVKQYETLFKQLVGMITSVYGNEVAVRAIVRAAVRAAIRAAVRAAVRATACAAVRAAVRAFAARRSSRRCSCLRLRLQPRRSATGSGGRVLDIVVSTAARGAARVVVVLALAPLG